MANTADIVIVGGGVHGASTAWHLAKRGAGKIILIEKEGIAAGASGWSSAIVRMHYTLESLTRVAMYGREMFGDWKNIVGVGESGFRQVGFLILFATAEVPHAREVIAMQQRLGINARMITPGEVGDIEPRLVRDDVTAGAWEPNSGHADGSTVANSFISAARDLGVEVRIGPEVLTMTSEGSRVTGVAMSDGVISAETVIVEAGFRTSELLAEYGVDLPITPVRHAITVVERTPDFGGIHPIVSDRIAETYFRPEAGSLTLIGEHDPMKGPVDEDVEAGRVERAGEPAGTVRRQVSRTGFGIACSWLHRRLRLLARLHAGVRAGAGARRPICRGRVQRSRLQAESGRREDTERPGYRRFDRPDRCAALPGRAFRRGRSVGCGGRLHEPFAGLKFCVSALAQSLIARGRARVKIEIVV